MSQISSLPPFILFQSPGQAATSYGDTETTAEGGQFYYQATGSEGRMVHGPIPKLGPTPMHEAFFPSTDVLSSVRGSWRGTQRDITIRDIDKTPNLGARLGRDPNTKELVLAVSNANPTASHTFVIPLRVDGSGLAQGQVETDGVLATMGNFPTVAVNVVMTGGDASVTLYDTNGKGTIYGFHNGDTQIKSNGTVENGTVTMHA